MPKLDNNIYGIDESSYATGIANSALKGAKGDEDFWGAVVDQSAKAEGSTPDKGEVKIRKFKEDSPGKRSEGN